MDRLSQIYMEIDAWMVTYRQIHPDDDREDIDIFLDGTVYRPDSPYWPHPEGKPDGTL